MRQSLKKPMERIKFFFPTWLLARLRKAAMSSGLAQSTIVREGVEMRLKEIEASNGGKT